MKNIDTTNKDVIIGSKKSKFFIIDPPLPSTIDKTSLKTNNKVSSVTIKSKRKGCSGCGRRRG